MNKQEIEKSLKRYLKKRISYTFSLLIAFLITGGFATASELNQEVLLSRIKEDREKLEKMLQENYIIFSIRYFNIFFCNRKECRADYGWT